VQPVTDLTYSSANYKHCVHYKFSVCEQILHAVFFCHSSAFSLHSQITVPVCTELLLNEEMLVTRSIVDINTRKEYRNFLVRLSKVNTYYMNIILRFPADPISSV